MSERAVAWIIVVVMVLVLIVLALSGAEAQAPRGPAMEQYARDLKDHRDWLESQLATAKARLAELEAAVLACGNRSVETQP